MKLFIFQDTYSIPTISYSVLMNIPNADDNPLKYLVIDTKETLVIIIDSEHLTIRNDVRMSPTAKESSAKKNDGHFQDDEVTDLPHRQIFHLSIKRQPPNFVYVGETFPIDVIIVADDALNANECHEPTAPTDFTHPPQSVSSDVITPDQELVPKEISECTSFDLIPELVVCPNDESHHYPIKSTTIAKKSHASLSVTRPKLSSDEAKRVHELFTLNLVQYPVLLQVGVVGTIYCSISRCLHGNDDGGNKILYDDAQVLFQIRIVALHSDGKHSHQTSMEDVPKANRLPKLLPTTQLHQSKSSTRMEVTTTSIAIVAHKILITSCCNDGSKMGNDNVVRSWNPVWYKDEGGRDKCMEIMVGVYDRHHVALFEAIPLLLILCYARTNQQQLKKPQLPVPVSNQDILRILSPKPNQKFLLDSNTGTMKIRFRVEDVSKNHQGQDFCLLIAASMDDTDDHNLITRKQLVIAPAVSLSVNIRSKRNKRPRQSSAISSAISVPASDETSEHINLHRTAVQHPLDLSVPEAGASESLENLPNSMSIRRIQDVIQNVVYWAEDVVSAMYELQRYQSQNDSSVLPMAQLLDAYNYYVRGQFDLLQHYVHLHPSSSERPYTISRETYHNPAFHAHDSFRFNGRPTDSNNYGLSYGHNRLPPIPMNDYRVHQHVNPYFYQSQNQHYYPMLDSTHQQPYLETDYLSNTAISATQGEMVVKHYDKHGYSQIAKVTDTRGPKPNQHLKMSKSSTLSHMSLATETDIGPRLAANIDGRKSEKLTSETESNRLIEVEESKMKFPSEVVIKRAVNRNQVLEPHDREAVKSDTRENEVEFILAKQFKSVRSGSLLGYPAYNMDKELVGFYQQSKWSEPTDPKTGEKASSASSLQNQTKDDDGAPLPQTNGNHVFIPIPQEDFGAKELEQAKCVLQKADQTSIQSRTQYGSTETMLHRALVYEWSKGLD